MNNLSTITSLFSFSSDNLFPVICKPALVERKEIAFKGSMIVLLICAFILHGYFSVGRQSAFLDLPVCLLVISIAIIPTLVFKKLSRWQGALMATIYIGYVAVLDTNSSIGYLPFSY